MCDGSGRVCTVEEATEIGMRPWGLNSMNKLRNSISYRP